LRDSRNIWHVDSIANDSKKLTLPSRGFQAGVTPEKWSS